MKFSHQLFPIILVLLTANVYAESQTVCVTQKQVNAITKRLCDLYALLANDKPKPIPAMEKGCALFLAGQNSRSETDRVCLPSDELALKDKILCAIYYSLPPDTQAKYNYIDFECSANSVGGGSVNTENSRGATQFGYFGIGVLVADQQQVCNAIACSWSPTCWWNNCDGGCSLLTSNGWRCSPGWTSY